MCGGSYQEIQVMKDFIQFGSRKIDYQLKFSDRKSLGITVTPEAQVLVNAPLDSSKEKIREKILKRAPWILKQQSYFLSFQPRVTEKLYISGETHLYLGRQYQLKITDSKAEKVKLSGGFLIVSTSDKSKAKALVNQWYLNHARIQFEKIAKPIVDRFQLQYKAPDSLILRNMPLRWGSCTPKGKILLNPELIKAPKGCIEYVIVHELCHLIHRDHSPAFFQLQARYMSDWERWKEKLERLMA
jgi:hypothetical protein